MQAEAYSLKSELKVALSKIKRGMQILEEHGDDFSSDDFKYLKGLLLMTKRSILWKQGHVEEALTRYLESESLFGGNQEGFTMQAFSSLDEYWSDVLFHGAV